MDDELKAYLDRKAEEEREFVRGLVERNKPETAMQRERANKDLMSSDYAKNAAARAAERQGGDEE